MNDRYLFKTKHSLHSKKWYVGNIIKESDGIYIKDIENNSRVYVNDLCTICQCTGLKDKAGTLIWENDVVLTPKEDGYSLICWNDTEARWEMHNETEGIVLDFDNYWSNEIEVCGNRFDNPELLEVE